MADRIGGKYILLVGVLVFAIGFGTLTFVAGPDSTWINFLVPAIVAGAGDPMQQAARRDLDLMGRHRS